ncbi:hypothetical protein C8Q70DRAFT_1057264 [Cubamyces menziesii]|nr:hypothetical protein C8Q70DRAFT_1057264 [Cubamyces menziesii]
MSALFAPLRKVSKLFTRPSSPASSETAAPPPQAGGSPRSVRPLSRASSITLGAPPPMPPSPVTPTQPSTLVVLTHQHDLIADFWGGHSRGMQVRPQEAPASRAHTAVDPPRNPSRNQRQTSMDTFEMDDLKAPPEPKTLARTLFLFGFAFPLLWLIGVAFICLPTKYDPDLESAPVGSAEQMQRHKEAYRTAEDKWAKRCLWAFIILVGLLAVVIVAIMLAKKGQ